MSIESMCKDIITVKHTNGSISNNVKANINKKSIDVSDVTIPCKEGDIVEHTLSAIKITSSYKVISAYCPRNHHWILDVEKM